ncbi:MAG: hypothetical protein KGS09_13770 [Nitrospirae bacterium]|nr:hypothetical protein [Nitrospirota bacterium]MDE3042012.1 hypothetical protein [Nitrospirota bacterium]
MVSNWPIARPADWVVSVNGDEGAEEFTPVRQSVVRSQPYDATEWMTAMIEWVGRGSTVRSEGRPRKVLVENVPATVRFGILFKAGRNGE